MDIRFNLALLVGKITAFMLSLIGSGATAAPGLYALNVDPGFVKKFSRKIPAGSIVVSGTNGKTTTSRLIYDLLSPKYEIIHNREGSNLLRGLASTFINESSVFGTIKKDIALWEVDEAVLPEITHATNPKTIILLNLFRDQLDRYGEVDSIQKSWQSMLINLPKLTDLIINEDDPGIKHLGKYANGSVLTFGIQDKQIDLPKTTNVSDIKRCPNCNSSLNYSVIFSAHVGHYRCSSCSLKRTEPTVSANKLIFKKDFKTSFILTTKKNSINININLPGLYNVYNILAASTAAYAKNTDHKIIKSSLESFSSAFGRYQEFSVGGKKVVIFLIKNPTGANEVLKTVSLEKKLDILAILNDKIADGTDTSWIWDTNWEIISKKVNNVYVSGTRSWDLANRLKYSGINLSKKNVYREINYSIENFIINSNNKNTLLILPTYTALLEAQKVITRLTNQKKWHQN